MLNSKIFCDLIEALKDYVDGVDTFEHCLSTTIENSFMRVIIDRTLSALTTGFFSDEELSIIESLDTNSTEYLNLKFNLDTITDILHYYCFSSNFGRSEYLVKDMLIVRDECNNIIEQYDVKSSKDLYEIIKRLIERSDDFYSYTINC